ncbi:MAG: glycosyltransferase family 4 protein [Acidobacteria bacterium]|nr:glycosyltransferase family 4 protein [Acidobacteriota bacterium]
MSASNDPAVFSAPPRMWLVSEVYYPEEISTGYYLTAIAEGIAADHPVSVLTGQPKHMARGVKAPKRETRNQVEIYRVWCTTFDKNFLVLRLINMFTVGVSMFVRSLFLFQKGDRILVCTAPPSLPFTTTAAALIKGSAVTVLVQDSYPEILEAVGTIKKGSLISRCIDMVNRWVFKYAAGIIVMGRDMQRSFEKKAEGLDPRIFYIPNWADLDEIEPRLRSQNELLADLGLNDKFVLLYAGNIGHPTDVETIIGAASRLRTLRPEIHFLFIGAGAKADWLKRTVENDSLSNVTILDYRPRSEQIIFLNACDIGLVALIRGMVGTAMPSRTYNLMAAGKPILALTEAGSELSMVIEENGIGWHTEPGDANALTKLILETLEDRKLLNVMGSNAREAALEKYSKESAVLAYKEAVFCSD